ncbi:CAP domain-containing protein [Devosia sp. CAU 1758]
MRRRPALLALGLLMLGLAASGAGAQESGDLAGLRQRALELVNASRAEADLPALGPGDRLNAAAQGHARDMLERDYYAHSSPEGDTVQDRFLAEEGSRWELVAENIARCAACTDTPDMAAMERLHQGWMDSPEHRANIMAKGLARFGFGIITDAEQGLYAVQTFAGPGTSRGLEAGAPARPIERRAMTAALLEPVNAARIEAGLDPIEPNAALESAAESLVPVNLEEFVLDGIGNVFDALGADAQAQWSSLFTLAGACGGCGIAPTDTDMASFASQWLDQPQYRQSLLDPEVGAAGVIVRADGEGRKVALLVLGTQR